MMLATTPAPSASAVLSPGIAISVPAGRCTTARLAYCLGRRLGIEWMSEGAARLHNGTTGDQEP
jgi:hypothetical protein